MNFTGNIYRSIYTQTGKFSCDVMITPFSSDEILLKFGNSFSSGNDFTLKFNNGQVFDTKNQFIGSYQIRNDHVFSVLADGEKYDLYIDNLPTSFGTPLSGYSFDYLNIKALNSSGNIYINFSGQSPNIIFNSEDYVMDHNGNLIVPFHLDPYYENKHIKIYDIEFDDFNNLSGTYFTKNLSNSGRINLIGDPKNSGTFYQNVKLITSAGNFETGFSYIRSVDIGGEYIDLYAYDSSLNFDLVDSISGEQIYIATMDSARDYPTFDFKLESSQYINGIGPGGFSGYTGMSLGNATGIGNGIFSGEIFSGYGIVSTSNASGDLYYNGNGIITTGFYSDCEYSKSINGLFTGINEIHNVSITGYTTIFIESGGVEIAQEKICFSSFNGYPGDNFQSGEFPFLFTGNGENLTSGDSINIFENYVYRLGFPKATRSYLSETEYLNATGIDSQKWSGILNESCIISSGLITDGIFLGYLTGLARIPISGTANFKAKLNFLDKILAYDNSTAILEAEIMWQQPNSFYLEPHLITCYKEPINWPDRVWYHDPRNMGPSLAIGDIKDVFAPESLSGFLILTKNIENTSGLWSGIVERNNVYSPSWYDGLYTGSFENLNISKLLYLPKYIEVPISPTQETDSALMGYIFATGFGSGMANGKLNNGSGWLFGDNGEGFLYFNYNGYTGLVYETNCKISGFVSGVLNNSQTQTQNTTSNTNTGTSTTGIDTSTIYTGRYIGDLIGEADFSINFISGNAFNSGQVLDAFSNSIVIDTINQYPINNGDSLIQNGLPYYPSNLLYITRPRVSLGPIGYGPPKDLLYLRYFDSNGNSLNAIQPFLVDELNNPGSSILSGFFAQLESDVLPFFDYVKNNPPVYPDNVWRPHSGDPIPTQSPYGTLWENPWFFYNSGAQFVTGTNLKQKIFNSLNSITGGIAPINPGVCSIRLPAICKNQTVDISLGNSYGFIDYLPYNYPILFNYQANKTVVEKLNDFPNRYARPKQNYLWGSKIYDVNGQTGFFTGNILTTVTVSGQGEAFGKWSNNLNTSYNYIEDKLYSGTCNVTLDFSTGYWLTGYFQSYPWEHAESNFYNVSIKGSDYFSMSPGDGKPIIKNDELTQDYIVSKTSNKPYNGMGGDGWFALLTNSNFTILNPKRGSGVQIGGSGGGGGEIEYPIENLNPEWTEFLGDRFSGYIEKYIYVQTGSKKFEEVWDLQTGIDLENFSQKFSKLNWTGENDNSQYYSDDSGYLNTGGGKGLRTFYAKVSYKNPTIGTNDYARLTFDNGLTSSYLDIVGTNNLY